MDPNNNEATRLWRVFRTAHQMVHDRVMISSPYSLERETKLPISQFQ
jgi:DNA-directed RNA polymerase I, II, and III subunit RPABC1